MFSKLKEKLKTWTKKISKETEEKVSEVEEKTEQPKEKEIPVKYDIAKHKYEPDVEKIKEIKEDLKKEISTKDKSAPEKPGQKKSPEKPVPEQKEESKPGTESFFKKVTSKVSKIKISEKEFEIYSEELEMLLLENNVALEVAEKIIKELKEKITGQELLKKEVESEVRDCLKEIIDEILLEPFDLIEKIKEKKDEQEKEPYVILFCGINGTGKTTTIAKIAKQLQKKNLSCVLAAADTFRAASIEQIKKHGDKLEVKVVAHEYGADPAAVGFDAIQYAKKNFINCVLIDTAGRIHTDKNLMAQVEKISKVCKPDAKIFIGEAIAGNDILEQVRSFDWAVGIDGTILTKADTDEKGGTALSVGYVTKKPILYLGTGQEYEKLERFDKKRFVEELGL